MSTFAWRGVAWEGEELALDMVGVTGSIPVAPTISTYDGTDPYGSAI
jgi:hypothetical protein